MRISEITAFRYDANYSGGEYSMSRGRISTGQPSLVVRLRTDDGFEGWAETAPLGSDYLPSSFTGELAALEELAPHVLGLDPRSPASVNAVMDRAMMSGMAAKAVIDVACWDILGKATQLPTSTLLGGCLSPDSPAFSVVGVGSPEVGIEKAQAELEKGLKAMQLKVGDHPLHDARRVRAIREALPHHIELWADANGGWNLEQALMFAKTLTVPVPLEQPCRLLSDCAEVGRRTGLPIILDESIVTMADLVAAYTAGITGVNVKLSRVGGFTKARALRDAAVALDMMVTIDDTWGCALTTAQNLQLAASTPADRLRAVDVFVEWTNPAISKLPRMKPNGRVGHSSSPGNGLGPIDMKLLGQPIFEIKG